MENTAPQTTEATPSNVVQLQSPADPKRMPNLAKALARAQLEIQNAGKNMKAEIVYKDGGAKRELKYADLAAVMDVIREPLAKNGLAFTQFPITDANGVTVLTRLMHESGEYLEASLWLPVPLKTPQGYGSSITYARRYGLSAMLGVASEDDDGMGGPMQVPGAKAPPRSTKPQPQTADTTPMADGETMTELDKIAARLKECASLQDVEKLAGEVNSFAAGNQKVRDVMRKIFNDRRMALQAAEKKK